MFTKTFNAEPGELSNIRAFVRVQAEGFALPLEATQDLILAVSEACANVVRHTPSREVRLTLTRLSDGVAIEVKDTGVFSHRTSVANREGGYGIPVMLRLVDEFSIREGREDEPGTVVRLVKRAVPVASSA